MEMLLKSGNSSFVRRHIGSTPEDIHQMLHQIGIDSIDQLIDETVPANIRLENGLDLPEAQTEEQFLAEFGDLIDRNILAKSFIGQGYYNTFTPKVILRNILENPGWYTAYTPYQAEIAQGRLEALINYQTMIIDLTGMEVANASLLDEATAAAEAMNMFFASRAGELKSASKILVSKDLFPQTIDVLATRANPLGIELVIADVDLEAIENPEVFAVFMQYPDKTGRIIDLEPLILKAKQKGLMVAVASDLLALTLLTPPGDLGADVVFGSSQRFGVPMGFGGPHAAFFATKDSFKRLLPGRIIGVSIDAEGNKAYRMALQTREQHIRREKATSNICTAQVLLSVIAGSYAVFHGPLGLKEIALNAHHKAITLAQKLSAKGYKFLSNQFFDTVTIVNIPNIEVLRTIAESKSLNFFYASYGVSIAFDETSSDADVERINELFETLESTNTQDSFGINSYLQRKTSFLTHPVFNSHHSEHEMLRYLKQLENKDLSMVHSMISLGSCTMKLNATTEMIPVTWPKIGGIHPFAPQNQTLGYQAMFKNLEKWLAEITGFHGVSLQPNSGAQGEYAGLMVIRAFHESSGSKDRNIALIPSSAHGTNPASAVMAGMKVVVVKCDDKGNIDIEDLKRNAEAHAADLSCLMVTYPSTHGVFEESIVEICEIIHAYGGQVYMDGANMNAQVGLTSPGKIGADVCHLNLHKTFCIPHGGGGPGMGPICVAKHLTPFLPSHVYDFESNTQKMHAVSAAPWGSASILPISYAYIAMMGGRGLQFATQMAILNANYIKSKLEKYYPVLYAGKNGRCAHEMILDCRQFKTSAGIEVEDIAKRLMDYGFHAPTVSFPVAGTLMIEPTESESKAELDRFCEAMISIRMEIEEIERGEYDKLNNVLKNAPHTATIALQDEWTRPYTRNKAVFPLDWVKQHKFWPSVSRIDGAFGDRNLVCSCIPIESYADSAEV